MAKAPRLNTERLTLMPFSAEFLTQGYVAWLNEPEVVRFSEQRHRSHTVESCRRFAEAFAGGPNHLWAIIEKEQGFGHIGNINTNVDAPNRTADIAILIGDKRAWSQGLGGEAWNAVVNYLLGPAGMRKVTAGAIAENKAMVAIMRASGMAEEGRRRNQMLLGDRPVDVIITGRLADV